jgi:DNA-binding transcriptional ArsR family regulator
MGPKPQAQEWPEDRDEHLHWRALSDPTRRRILDLLRTNPRTTGDVAAAFPMSRVAVMKHLDVLATAGLVVSRKKGRQRWHYVNLAPLMRLHERWSTPLSEGLATGLLAIKDRVEDVMSAEVSTMDMELEVVMAAPAEKIFAAITREPGAWWGPPYLRPDASSLVLDGRIGGRLVEHWADGGQVMATVTGLTDDRWLQLTGPFHLGNAVATVDFNLSGDDDTTVVGLSFSAYGLIDPDMAAAFQGAWRTLVGERLKAFVEDGTRLGIDPG